MDRATLKDLLQREGFPLDSFSVEGAWLEDAIVLRQVGDEWHLKYIEKGHATDLGTFADEHQACEEMYRQVHDSWPKEMPRLR